MRYTILAVLFIITALFLANFAFGAISEESSAAASVTVNTFVDILITDRGTGGINFGSLDPGTTDNPEAAQNATHGAVNFSVQPTTNLGTVNVKLSGTDFISGGNTLGIGNVTADDNPLQTSPIILSTINQTLTTLSPSGSVEIFYFIDVPTAQTAAIYSSTFNFAGD